MYTKGKIRENVLRKTFLLVRKMIVLIISSKPATKTPLKCLCCHFIHIDILHTITQTQWAITPQHSPTATIPRCALERGSDQNNLRHRLLLIQETSFPNIISASCNLRLFPSALSHRVSPHTFYCWTASNGGPMCGNLPQRWYPSTFMWSAHKDGGKVCEKNSGYLPSVFLRPAYTANRQEMCPDQ